MVYLVLLTGAAAGILALQQRQLHPGRGSDLQPEALQQQERLRLKGLQLLPRQGFGFNNLIADWAFLRFLQYYGDDQARQTGGYGLSPNFFEVMIQRDPRFIDAHFFMSGTLAFDLGQPELAIAYLKQGTDAIDPKRQPRAYLIWHLIGLNQLLLLNDLPNTIAAYEKAAEWAQVSPVAEDRDNVELFQRMANFLKTNPDSTPVRVWAWSTIYQQAEVVNDRNTQARARRELLALGATETRDQQGQIQFIPPKPKASPQPQASPASP
jgi:tetratricopeptide (TPR) repeat protein